MTANQQQSAAWNGPESRHYVDHADRYDRQLAPFTAAVLDRARPASDEAVLDVGCGSGATTLAAARTARRVLGLDVSEPLLAVAAERAREASRRNVELLRADAQTHGFDARFDVVLSQFGLMFFDEPVAAFTNLRRALVPGGRLVSVSWQALEVNEWLMVLGRVVARYGELPELGGLAAGPGMFALRDPDEIAALLAAAGFVRIEVEEVAPTIVVGGGGGLDDSVEFLLGTGIVRGLLGGVEPDARPTVLDDARSAWAERYVDGSGIRLGARGWLIAAAT